MANQQQNTNDDHFLIDIETSDIEEKWSNFFYRKKEIDWTLIKTADNLCLTWEEKQEDRFITFFPTISQIAAEPIGMDLVSVRPMSAPTGMLFYIDSYVHCVTESGVKRLSQYQPKYRRRNSLSNRKS